MPPPAVPAAHPPVALRDALERLLDGVPFTALRQASDRLTAAYRAGTGTARPASAANGTPRRLTAACRAGAGTNPPPATEYERLAYLAARLPSTCAATCAVLGELRRRAPRLRAESLLELGAGPAPGLWAAAPHFSALSRATHVEIDAGMAGLGRRLLAAGGFGARVESTWCARDLGRARELAPHDLVLAGYVLGELPAPARDALVDAAWDLTASALVIVEPGTPAGSARVIRARTRLLERGATVAAPCPHGAACPLAAGDWCHFGARVSRSGLQRRLKGGSLPYEDEKYAYLAVTRGDAEPCAARVLRRPAAGPRRVSLRLCAAGGLDAELVTRRAGDRYRAARKLRWGDGWRPSAADRPAR